MLSELMKKLGYVKESEIIGFQYCTDSEKNVLRTVELARDLEADMFIDFLQKTKTQKVYIKEKGKKKATVRIEF